MLEPADLDERGWGPGGDGVDHRVHHLLGLVFVGFAVGGHDPMLDPPGRFHLDMLVDGERHLPASSLFLGEQVGAGTRAATGVEERITGYPTVAER